MDPGLLWSFWEGRSDLYNMNVQGKIQACEVDQQDEIQNDVKQPLLETVEDANANQIIKYNIYSDDRDHDSPLPPLVLHSEAQERIIVWGTHVRNEDPELEEFELLECQDLETSVVEEEEQVDMQSERSRKGAKNFSDKELSSTAISTTFGSPWKDHNENHSVDGDANENSQPLDLRTSSSRSGANRTLRDARSGSESNVFSSSLSAVTSLSGSLASALDSAGCTQPLSSLSTKSTSDKGRNQHAAPIESYIQRNRELPRDLDQNHNSATLPQEPQYDRSKLMYPSYGAAKLQKFQMEAEMNAGKRMSTEVPKGMVRVLPSCRQLVRPLSTEKQLTSGYTSIDTQADQQQSHFSETGQTHPQVLPNTELHSNPIVDSETPSNQTFTQEAKRLRRQSSADRAASPSSLERKTHFNRRAYSSPTRPSTPPSPKTIRSPQRQPPSSPIKTLPSRGPQLGYTGYSSGLRAPVKTTINTSIHKTPPQQVSMETSPPSKCLPKPKSVRPKIITYIRKTPQVKPQSLEGTYEVSSLPTRLSTYSSTQAKPAVGEQRDATVLSASNLLYDKYRQEMQKVRFFSPGLMVSGIKPPSNTMPHKLASRADSFYGSLNKPLSAAVRNALEKWAVL